MRSSEVPPRAQVWAGTSNNNRGPRSAWRGAHPVAGQRHAMWSASLTHLTLCALFAFGFEGLIPEKRKSGYSTTPRNENRGGSFYTIKLKSACRKPDLSLSGLDPVSLSKIETHLLASLGSTGKNRNSLACLRNAGFHFAESYCIHTYIHSYIHQVSAQRHGRQSQAHLERDRHVLLQRAGRHAAESPGYLGAGQVQVWRDR